MASFSCKGTYVEGDHAKMTEHAKVLGFTKQGLCPCGMVQLRKKTLTSGWKETGNICDKCEGNKSLEVDGMIESSCEELKIDDSLNIADKYIKNLILTAQEANKKLAAEKKKTENVKMQLAKANKLNDVHVACQSSQKNKIQQQKLLINNYKQICETHATLEKQIAEDKKNSSASLCFAEKKDTEMKELLSVIMKISDKKIDDKTEATFEYNAGWYTGEYTQGVAGQVPHGLGVWTAHLRGWDDRDHPVCVLNSTSYGDQYEGAWKNGQKHGKGISWHPSSVRVVKIIRGTWKFDILMLVQRGQHYTDTPLSSYADNDYLYIKKHPKVE